MFVAMQILLPHFQYLFSFRTLCIQTIQIIDIGWLGEGYCNSIHRMIAMVVAFSPCLIFYLANNLTIFVLVGVNEPKSVILVPNQFLQDIYKLPIITKPAGDVVGTTLRVIVLSIS